MAEWMNIPEMADEQPEKRIHLERYEYAASVLAGKRVRVLDCACGMGYGTALLAQTCDVVGVDMDAEAIDKAEAEYPGCHFELGNIYSFPMGGFDALVSFETLEHLNGPGDVIDRLPQSITDVVLSAPIRPTVGWNPWHRSDFTHGSLCRLLEDRDFRIVHVIGQPWVDGKGDLYLIVHARRGAWTL